MCDIQLPFGRHHIHCDLFAPTRGKFDCYWHVFLTPRTIYTVLPANALRPLNITIFFVSSARAQRPYYQAWAYSASMSLIATRLA